MEIGNRISLLRNIREISRKDLAEGVISISHLSNLEGGRYTASEDTLISLAKKLDVPTEYLTGNHKVERNLEVDLNSLLEKIILDSKGIEDEFDSFPKSFHSLEYEIAYNFLKCSYFFKKNKIEEASFIEENYIKYVISSTYFNYGNMPDYFKKTYLYYSGISSYRNNNLSASFSNYKALLDFPFSEEILSDLNYNLALISYKQLNYLNSLKYCELSLSNYINLGNWKKVGGIYNFLGGIYSSLNIHDEALIQLDKALNIAKPMGHKYLEAMIYHNKGITYSKMEGFKRANQEFRKSLQLKSENDYPNILVTLFELISNDFTLGNIKEAKVLLKKAPQYLTNPKDYHRLLSLQAVNDLIENDETNYLNKKGKALEFFLHHGYLEQALGISEELGDYYQKIKKYKKAAYYYKQELTIKDMYKKMDIHEKN